MAKATLIPEKTETIVKVVEPKKIILELDENEATTLRIIFNNIGGCPYSSPRKYVDDIKDKLDSVFYSKAFPLSKRLVGEIVNGRLTKDTIYFSRLDLDFKEKK
jgi:hypothetical protein